MAERLALLTSDHRVAGSNPAGGKILTEPVHDKTNKMAFVPSENSDQPGHLALSR